MTNVFYDNKTLIALVPVGGKPEVKATTAILKLKEHERFVVKSSVLQFFDTLGNNVGTIENAFGLKPGEVIATPCYQRLSRRPPPPETAVLQKWTLNEFTVSMNFAPPNEHSELIVTYLPLSVPVPDDIDFHIKIINKKDTFLDFAASTFSSSCFIDGQEFQNEGNGNWNGSYRVLPNHSRTHGFHQRDFEDLEFYGTTEISICFAGLVTPIETIRWL